MTHTPGPWGYDGTGCVYSHALPKDDCVIAELLYADGDWEADGRLMAAAPELLAALKAHVPWRDEPVQGWRGWTDAVRAIAKAEGRSE